MSADTDPEGDADDPGAGDPRVEGTSAAGTEGPGAGGAEVEVLEFDLGSERYCVDIAHVSEVVDAGGEDPTAVPNAPPYVDGVIDLRGRTTTIVDPRRLYGLEAETADAGAIVVFDEETLDADGAVGWTVDEVHQVSRVSPADVDGVGHDETVEGVVNREDGFLIWASPEAHVG